jgi:serine/threonine-protein kinase
MAGITLADLDAVADLIEAALERPATERGSFLREACADDPDLLTTAERLLPMAEEALAFLDVPAAVSAGELLREAVTDREVRAAEAVEPPPLPDRVGAWRVLRQLGRGGMGDVWLAERDDAEYRRLVAIKVVRAGIAAPDLTARFRHERQILAALDHPGIARLYDGGVADDGRPYIVMEYVEGRPLDAYCDEHELDVDRRLALFSEVCDAVAWAHRKLVVHRDIKPANILVDGDGRVKLLDFGVAKLIGPDEDGPVEASPITRFGFRVLTPEYASPEQFLGGPVSTATDVYSLGVLLFELLAGRSPYNLTDKGPRAVERAVLEDEPDRPSVALGRQRVAGETSAAVSAAEVARRRGSTPDRLRRRLVGDLDTITLTALRKEPDQRYASVDALREDVRRHRARLPIVARPQTWSYRSGRFFRRHRVGVALVALLVLSLGAGATTTVWQARAAALEARKAGQISDFLIGVFEVADPDQARGESVTARELLDRGAARVDVELAGQPEVRADMLAVLGSVYRRLGLIDGARVHLERALDLRRSTGAPPEDVAESLTDLANALFAAGEYENAEALQREALAIGRGTDGTSCAAFAAVTLDIAASLSARGEYDDARPRYEAALRIYRAAGDSSRVAHVLNGYGLMQVRAGEVLAGIGLLERSVAMGKAELGPVHTRVAVSLCNLASGFERAGEYDAAAATYDECLSIRRTLLEPDHPDTGRTLNNIARLADIRGDLDAADSLYREALEIRRNALGEFHQEVAGTLNNMAVVAYRRGDYDGAARTFREVLAQWRELVGDDHPHTITTLNNLGMTLILAGDLAAAEATLNDALEGRIRALGPDHPQVGESRTNLAGLLVELGRHAEAEAENRSAVAILDAAFPDGHPTTAAPLVGLARALRPQGRCAEAIPSVERAIQIRADRLGDDHPLTADARLWLGRCLTDLGRHADAIATLETALAALVAANGEDHATSREAAAALQDARRAR